MKKIYTKPNMKIVSFQTESITTADTVSSGGTQTTFGYLGNGTVTYNSDK
ncbi:MAG: hypothetical protein LIO87_07420 [Eubacterium sp.]|nr:hypothetical protein [Eubacterium sp.]